jgi:hypothetical protein
MTPTLIDVKIGNVKKCGTRYTAVSIYATLGGYPSSLPRQ